MIRRPPSSPLFPYTPLSRSPDGRSAAHELRLAIAPPPPGATPAPPPAQVDPIAAANMMLKASREMRSEEHTSELQSPDQIVCRLLLEKIKNYRPVLIKIARA